MSNVTARQPDGTVVAKTFLRDGRVVMIHDQPLLELTRQTDGRMNLRLFSRPGDAHDLERAGTVAGPWDRVERLRFYGRERQLSLETGTQTEGFFRLASVDVSTPFLQILARDESGMDIAFYAERGLTFDLQTRSDLNLPWTTWQSPTMTNSFYELRLNFAPGGKQFLRAHRE
jgi:hypothetical protein